MSILDNMENRRRTRRANLPKEESSTPALQRQLRSLRTKNAELSSLIEVSIIINSTLDLGELMNLVMEKAQSVMTAEASSIMLLNEQTNKLEFEVALGSAGDRLRKTVQLDMGQGIAGWVAKHRKPVIVQDAGSDPRFYAQADQESGFKTKSILCVPLEATDKLIGVAQVINRQDGKPFTKDNLELFSTFARQVALTIDNARMHHFMIERERLQQQLESAHHIQQSFMPQTFPSCPHGRYKVGATNLPASMVGGDFYDFIVFDEDTLGVVIGDVSGKGIPAALYMARLVSDVRYYSQSERDPGRILTAVNSSLTGRGSRGMFVTLSFMILNTKTGQIELANAGHLPFVRVFSKERRARTELTGDATGAPLGILADASYGIDSMRLSPGDSVVMVTDGVMEAKNVRSEQFGLKRLRSLLTRKYDHPMAMIDSIVEKIGAFTKDAQQHDDITLVATKWR